MKDPQTIESTSQTFLDIYDVTNDILIMEDGSASLILALDAVNFDLLAEEEQDAIMYSYAGLLNSLNYPVQIVIRSQTKDVSSYLKVLQEKEENTFDEKKRNNIKEYRQFVGELIKERNVLDKKFYVAIPASALELGLVSAQSVIPGIKPKQAVGFEKSVVLDKALTNLHPKRDHLIGQFARIGLYARQLTTQEIIQLFYTSYNPEAAEGQVVADTKNYTSPLIEAGLSQGVTMMDNPTTTPPMGATTPAGTMPSPIGGATPTMPAAPTMPPTPTMSPTPAQAPMPTMGEPVVIPKPDEAQSAINNTLNQIGGLSAPTPPAMDMGLGAPTPAVMGTTPASVSPPAGDIKPSGDVSGNPMPPLPEI